MKQFLFSFIIACTALAGCHKEIQPAQAPAPIPPVNRPPLARAGNDTIIFLPANLARLTGSSSYDPDNNIMSYSWTKQSGPASVNIVRPDSASTDVTGLVRGVYEFTLAVTDSSGEVSKDTCTIRVDAPWFWISINPHDTLLNLPFNTVLLKASTWSMTNAPIQPAAVNIEWRKVAGPGNYLISAAADLSTTISNMIDGLYAFECRITDSFGQVKNATAMINVTDTTNATQQVIVPDQTWNGTMGECIYIQIKLSQYVPANRSIKKVFVKQDCDSVYKQAFYYLQTPANAAYGFQFDFYNNEAHLNIYECVTFSICASDTNNKPDVKIFY